MNMLRYVSTATCSCLFPLVKIGDICIPQLGSYFFHRWIFRNFWTTFPLTNALWYIHTTILKLPSFWWTHDNIHVEPLWNDFPIYLHTPILKWLSSWRTHDNIDIPQLWNDFRIDEHTMIYTYHNFETTFPLINIRWYIHAVTLKWSDFPFDSRIMIYTYRNFEMTFPLMNAWWHIHTATLKWLSHWWTHDDIYTP